MKWRSIESAPKDGTHILIYAPLHKGKPIYVVAYHAHKNKWIEANHLKYCIRNPTHWMPLKPPKIKNE